MERSTGRQVSLRSDLWEKEVCNGFYVLKHALLGVAKSGAFAKPENVRGHPPRMVAGPGSWLKASVEDLAKCCVRDYVLRGGTIEFDSSGTLHVLWISVEIEAEGGELIFDARGHDPGLLLVDVTLRQKAPLLVLFKQVSRLTVTYDPKADITLIGMLGVPAAGLDSNVWSVVRIGGNVCGLSSEANIRVSTNENSDELLIRYYESNKFGDVCININNIIL
ncbi:hypothetical protein [Komagataeibacter europaeus]|uniref:hypothetical protein n=1 Tax=Komagataeibacter europaeus TaxID=33995 RepID=UPI0015F81A8D|nr:hypothetical protein [Komagataeibacter europaeus]